MINFYDENGNVIKHKIRNPNVGEQLSDMSNSIGAKNIIPFSSFHQYQREDSIWAQEYTTPEDSYSKGIKANHNYIEPFVLLNCETGKYEKINPKKLIVTPKKTELFGDNWFRDRPNLPPQAAECSQQIIRLGRENLQGMDWRLGGSTDTQPAAC